jgi:AAA+ superfamily predicted ATPase
VWRSLDQQDRKVAISALTDEWHCIGFLATPAGKTLLARAVAAESGAAFFSITGGSILSMWVLASVKHVHSRQRII